MRKTLAWIACAATLCGCHKSYFNQCNLDKSASGVIYKYDGDRLIREQSAEAIIEYQYDDNVTIATIAYNNGTIERHSYYGLNSIYDSVSIEKITNGNAEPYQKLFIGRLNHGIVQVVDQYTYNPSGTPPWALTSIDEYEFGEHPFNPMLLRSSMWELNGTYIGTRVTAFEHFDSFDGGCNPEKILETKGKPFLSPVPFNNLSRKIEYASDSAYQAGIGDTTNYVYSFGNREEDCLPQSVAINGVTYTYSYTCD